MDLEFIELEIDWPSEIGLFELKNYISEQNDNFYIVGGDFNIYSTTEK